MAFPKEACFKPLRKARRWLYGREIPNQQKGAADLCVVPRTDLTFSDMTLHANKLDTSKGIVYKSNVLITKLATIHGDRLRVR